ncbi:MAG: FHA domain-containing protein [Deltaproteobacteria bacterium]|nr:FHA domain-containing protein [Deltaproteobacteria bacterium]
MPGPPLAGQGAPMPMAGFGAAPGMPQQATLSGPPGIYPVTAVKEVRVGRDPGQCDICLAEPRISAVHAVLRFEGGQLLVRDEGSNNGTFVGGVRIAPHTWTPVPNGSSVKFGPAEFAVRLE